MKKQWKKIKDYDAYYVSNFGHIKSKNRILKNILNHHGYLCVNLSKKGKVKIFLTHRLVAVAFIENPKNKPWINHIDNNTKNNLVTNLEWCTPKENSEHCQKQGRKLGKNLGEKNKNSKLTYIEVKKIRNQYNKGERQNNIAKLFHIDQSNVSNIVNNLTWKV